mmetsp:Transcript_52854/g.128168  ORF Transcript_52854/g.128168 Transcript_52854/m.128168 type:complete len:786 (+) Transcript_52854:191-2548(+)
MKSSSTTGDAADVTTSDEEDILLNDDPDNGLVAKKPKSTKKKKKATKKQSNIVGSSMSSSGSSDDNDDSEITALTKPKSTKKKKKKEKTADPSNDDDGGGEAPPKKPKSTKKKQKKLKVTKDGGGGGGTGGNSTDDDDDDEIIAVPSFRKQPSGRGMAASAGGSGRGRGGRGPPPMRQQGTSYRNNGGGGGPAPPPSMRGRGMEMGKQPQSSSRINGNGGSGRGRGGGPPPGRGRGRGMPPRMSSAYAAPSSSIHRPPSTRNLPPPPGSASKGNSFALRSMGNSFAVRGSSSRHSGHRPTSILRSSSHHTGSNHAIKKTSIRGQAVRVNVDGTLTSTQSSGRVRTSSNDSFDDSFAGDIEEDDGFYGDDTDEVTPVVSRTPSLTIGSLSRSFRNLTDNKGLGAPAPSDDEGGPIIEGGPGSFDRRTNLSKFKSSQSMRSVLTMDLEFDDETRFIKFLRYIRILAPHPDEKPIKKRIRIITWVALFCDFLAAMVAITTYSGTTYCCGEPILSVAGDFDWDLCIQIVTILYLFLIFLEILPVVRDGFPFNLLNPIVGFLITFAVFFNDRIAEAVIMWIIEAAAVSCETAVYFLRRKAFNDRQERLMKTEQQVLELRGVKKRVKKQFESSRHLDLSGMSNHSAMSKNVSSDEDNDMYNSGDSFGDDSSFKDEASIDELTTNTNISNARELRLMRERRLLRQSQAEAERHLHWHLIGVCVNIFLVTLSLALIVSIASSGGLCMVDMTAPNVFDKNPLAKCPACVGYDTSEDGSCQICNDDGTSQCYYAY